MKILAVLVSLYSMSAFAGYKCKFTEWSHGIGGSVFVSGIPKTIKVDGDPGSYLVQGKKVASLTDLSGKIEYILNGEVECVEKDKCSLYGTIAEAANGRGDNASGLINRYKIVMNGEDESMLQMLDKNKILIIKCK